MAEFVDHRTRERTTQPSWVVLGTDGGILEAGGNIHALQDPASTTKIWTLYTLLAMVRDGHLPSDFFDSPQRRRDVERLIHNSDNAAAQRLAVAADIATGGTGEVSNRRLNAVPGFAIWMNRYANGDLVGGGQLPLDNTHFVTASGMNHADHYSTAYDMGLMMLRFRTDFIGQESVEVGSRVVGRGRNRREEPVTIGDMLELAGVSNRSTRFVNATTEEGFQFGTEYSKTGTARGNHGSVGQFSFVGASNHGVYAAAGFHERVHWPSSRNVSVLDRLRNIDLLGTTEPEPEVEESRGPVAGVRRFFGRVFGRGASEEVTETPSPQPEPVSIGGATSLAGYFTHVAAMVTGRDGAPRTDLAFNDPGFLNPTTLLTRQEAGVEGLEAQAGLAALAVERCQALENPVRTTEPVRASFLGIPEIPGISNILSRESVSVAADGPPRAPRCTNIERSATEAAAALAASRVRPEDEEDRSLFADVSRMASSTMDRIGGMLPSFMR